MCKVRSDSGIELETEGRTLEPSISDFIFYLAAASSAASSAATCVVRVARWLSPKFRTLAVAQNTELLTYELSCFRIIFMPDSPVKYRTPGNHICVVRPTL